MKFISHINVFGNHYAKTTFVVMKISDATFMVTPIQNPFELEQQKLSRLFVRRNGDSWKLVFENNENWLTNDMINQMLEKLELKLQEIQVKQEN